MFKNNTLTDNDRCIILSATLNKMNYKDGKSLLDRMLGEEYACTEKGILRKPGKEEFGYEDLYFIPMQKPTEYDQYIAISFEWNIENGKDKGAWLVRYV